MGSKPWQKLGMVFLGSMLLVGCQDPQRRENGLNKAPPPVFPPTTTPSNAPTGAWGSPNNNFKTSAPAGLSPAGTPGNLSGSTSSSGAPYSSGTYNTVPSTPGSTGQAIPIQPPANPGSFASPTPLPSNTQTNFGTSGLSPSFPPVSGPSAPALPTTGPSTPAPLPPGLGGM
jgi:hypothetical protein